MGIPVAVAVSAGVLVLATVTVASGLVALLTTGSVFGAQVTINRNKDEKSQICFIVDPLL